MNDGFFTDAGGFLPAGQRAMCTSVTAPIPRPDGQGPMVFTLDDVLAASNGQNFTEPALIRGRKPMTSISPAPTFYVPSRDQMLRTAFSMPRRCANFWEQAQQSAMTAPVHRTMIRGVITPPSNTPPKITSGMGPAADMFFGDHQRASGGAPGAECHRQAPIDDAGRMEDLAVLPQRNSPTIPA